MATTNFRTQTRLIIKIIDYIKQVTSVWPETVSAFTLD